MTREEAMKELSYIIDEMPSMECADWIEAISMAIEALEHEPCGDAISRQAVLNLAKFDGRDGLGSIIHAFDVEQLSPVNTAEKVGHWISLGTQGEIDGQIVRAFSCSECGAISVFRMTGGKIVNGDLCPNCGAKMQDIKNEQKGK